jgi:hypothetical protein
MRLWRSIWLLALCTACFRTTAPDGWLPTPQEAQTDAHGGWIRVEYQVGEIEGELLAATRDTIHVLAGGRWIAVPVSQVKQATLTGFNIRIQSLETWGLLGTLSTGSHGVFLILSAPTWIIASTAAASTASRAPRVQGTSPAELNVLARFPQGLPPDLDRATIRPKQPASH